MKYFAYGSNMDPNRMNRRNVGFSSRQHAILRGYSLRFNKKATSKSAKLGEGKGNIRSEIEGLVEGVLYEITRSGRDELDRHEIGYERVSVLVRLDDGTGLIAFTYVAQSDTLQEGLKPTKEYLSHYLKGFDILSRDYCRKLESWPTLD